MAIINSIQEFRSNFTKIYHSTVVPLLSKYEDEKNRMKNLALIVNIIIGGIFGVFLLLNRESAMDVLTSINHANGIHNGAVILGFPIAIIFIMIAAKKFIAKIFEKKLKTAVMPDLMKAFGDFHWTTFEVIDKFTLKQSTIFDHFEDKKDDDNFFGVYKDLKINISETELSYITRNSEGKRRKHITFRGVVVEIDVKKHFNGHTIIRRRELLNKKKYQEIKLEDPAFSKMYFVDGNDQVESRYLLTTAFMDRFKNLQRAFGAKTIEASFLQNKMLFAMETTKDMFTIGDLDKPLNDTKQFTTLLNEFISILAIVDELKLNQNIGL